MKPPMTHRCGDPSAAGIMAAQSSLQRWLSMTVIASAESAGMTMLMMAVHPSRATPQVHRRLTLRPSTNLIGIGGEESLLMLSPQLVSLSPFYPLCDPCRRKPSADE